MAGRSETIGQAAGERIRHAKDPEADEQRAERPDVFEDLVLGDGIEDGANRDWRGQIP